MTDESTPFIVADHLHSPMAVAAYLEEGLSDDLDTLRVFVRDAVEALKRLEAEREEDYALRDKLAAILTATANALKGEPDPRMAHSWHDLPEWGQAARDVAMRYLFSTGPQGGAADLKHFFDAIETWRTMFTRDVVETAEAMAMLDEEPIEK